MDKFRLLTADEIECRVKKISEKGAVILLYKTARTDMDLLDETVGAENWESDYREIKGNLFAGIGISTGRGIVWKWDCGIESREDGEGNQKKGEASDAFKRAGFKWGIGRELYSAPFVFFPASDMNISNGKTFDTFTISKIEYDDKRRITCLSITNDRTKKVWNWSAKSLPINPDKKQETTDEPEYKYIASNQVKALTDLAKQKGSDLAAIVEYYGFADIKKMNFSSYEKAMKALMKKADK